MTTPGTSLGPPESTPHHSSFTPIYILVNWMLRRIFGSKRDKVTGDLRKLHNEELHNFYTSPNIIRMINSLRG
jgi:hypothetical protein